MNFLTGKLFLGDTGSIFIGFMIAWAGISIVNASPNFSPWGVFLMIIYPATDIIFSVFRRIYSSKSPLKADNLHLHSLLYKAINKTFTSHSKNVINSASGFLITIFASVPVFLSVYFKGAYPITYYFSLVYFVVYIITYYFLIKYLVRV